jgi:hypothetical protein
MTLAKGFLALLFLTFSLFLMACSNRQGPTAANANSTLPPPAKPPQPASEPPTNSPRVNPERLIDIIKQLQMEFVRESFGLESGECFTDVDLSKFMREKKTAEIVRRLNNDKDFLALVNVIREMKSEDRSALLDKAQKTFKKTWRELRLDPQAASADKLREGQTDAGQKAERLIAQTVVNLVRQVI